MKTYNATEFALPKVVGLAVHNSVRRTEARVADLDKRDVYPTPPEVRSYCLFGVNPDCSVVPLASGDTASDMKTIVTKPNLALLGKKYGLIGFVYAKTPRSVKEYDTLSLPVVKGGSK
jgi:hypothetical protein